MKKLKVGVLGATGMVGQRFVSLLADHPWFELATVAASPKSAGKAYADAVAGRWTLADPVPGVAAKLTVLDASDVARVSRDVDFVCCAVDMDKAAVIALEEAYARAETPVLSNCGANRKTPDVPMMIPEINAHHASIIEAQRKRLGTTRGFIAVKPNCSLQSYVPALHPLAGFGIAKVAVCTYQALSGAGKTPATYPEMADNIIPFIGGEEEKVESETLKILGRHGGRTPHPATISAHTNRVAVIDGHIMTVSADLGAKPAVDDVIAALERFRGRPQELNLPSAPQPPIIVARESNRPQPRLDADRGDGMTVTVGRVRPCKVTHTKFVALGHNTVRGAAGAAILNAELMAADGLFD